MVSIQYSYSSSIWDSSCRRNGLCSSEDVILKGVVGFITQSLFHSETSALISVSVQCFVCRALRQVLLSCSPCSTESEARLPIPVLRGFTVKPNFTSQPPANVCFALLFQEIEVGGGRKAIIIFVPVPQLKSFQKIQVRLVRELEKKFSGKHVVFIAQVKKNNFRIIKMLIWRDIWRCSSPGSSIFHCCITHSG